MNRPTVSAIIPTFNRGDCIAETIESVLNQTRAPQEVVVVDDGSTDDTAVVCRKFGAAIRYISKPNGGASSARNMGIQNATGEWIAFLDADDIWLPQKLEVQCAAIEANPVCGWSFTNHLTTDRRGVPLSGVQGFERDFHCFRDLGASPELLFGNALRHQVVHAAGGSHELFVGDIYPLLFHGNMVFPSGALVKRSLAVEAGPWDENFKVAEDTEWFHRVAARGEGVVVMTRLTLWRRGATNTLMSGKRITMLVENALTSLDRALALRQPSKPTVRLAYDKTRALLLLRLAYGSLSAHDGAGARRALWSAHEANAPMSLTTAGIWLASWLPKPVLRALHGAKRALRSRDGNE
jgi:glycosyltransferase involved in cell wall biosynthesis